MKQKKSFTNYVWFITFFICIFSASCYIEWDIPKTKRWDHCTQQEKEQYVYFMTCNRTIPKQHPKNH